jgi:hypothetical protein
MWVEEAKLTASDAATGDEVGRSISVSGNVAIVGAHNDDCTAGVDCGSAYILALEGLPLPADCNANGIADECDTDCNANQVPDDCDIMGGASDDCNNNGVPDECESPADCNNNGTQDICDVAGGTSPDCNRDEIPDECQLGSNDCNENAIPDDCESAVDCNRNGLRDFCDLFNGTSADCDANSVPDECDVLALCRSDDCNANGRPDECDISSGASNDCNGNGRPDECDLLATPEDVKVTATDAMPYDGFGTSAAIDGHVAVIGAPGDDYGSASVFRFVGQQWSRETTLTALPTNFVRSVGQRVAVDGDTVVAGALSYACSVVAADDGCAAAYVFRFAASTSSWVQEAELIPAGTPRIHEDDGTPVALSGDAALLAAPRENCSGGFYCGAVHVFRRNGSEWAEEETLTPSDAASYDAFGASVSLSGNFAVVGKPYGDLPGIANCGTAYIFEFTSGTWVERIRLSASTPAAFDEFGRLVSIDGDRVVVTARSGAYVYRATESPSVWQAETTLISSRGRIDAVSLDGATIVLGDRTPNCPFGGEAFVFRFDAALGRWIEGPRLIASVSTSSDSFGGSVGVGGETVLVGAFGANCIAGVGCGAAYFFSPYRDRDCNDNDIPDECEDCNANGIPDECDLAACTGDPSCADRNHDSIPDGCEMGACCDQGSLGDCTDGLFQKECNCPRCAWVEFSSCDEVDCARESIPTLSAWGLAILSLLLLTGAKIRFGCMWRAGAG